ncbi:MAG: Gfo/Idh/MocA family oxidoreductase [Planctomycetota bacterium]
MDKLGYAIIGCGRVSRHHAQAISKLNDARLAAVADQDIEKARRVACDGEIKPTVYGDYDDLLADKSVDVVVIAIPTHLHRDLAVAAAEAGKHTYCEKAMAASMRQCREMIDAARRRGVKLVIGQSTRFQPACIMARRLIDDGAIGQVFAVDAQFATVAEPPSRGATDSWRYRAGSAGNGHVINFGCHYIDTARFFAGQDPASVSAYIGNLFSKGMIYEDQFCIMCTCDRGAVIAISLFSSLSGTRSPDEGYTVRGTDGIITVNWPARRVALIRDENTREAVEIGEDLLAEDGFTRLHRLFRRAIEEDAEVPLTGEMGMKNVEWGLAAYLSNERRRWIDLPLGDEHEDFTGPVLDATLPATRE